MGAKDVLEQEHDFRQPLSWNERMSVAVLHDGHCIFLQQKPPKILNIASSFLESRWMATLLAGSPFD